MSKPNGNVEATHSQQGNGSGSAALPEPSNPPGSQDIPHLSRSVVSTGGQALSPPNGSGNQSTQGGMVHSSYPPVNSSLAVAPTLTHQQPPRQTPYYSHPQDDSGSLAIAVAAGSVIGLAAAAAVRWLNGGDFYLFPPATSTTSATARTMNHSRSVAQEEIPDPEREPKPLSDSASMEMLVSRMQSQVDQHEKLLATFQTMTASQPHEQEPPADQSMDLLLRYDDSNTSTILREIRSALNSLQADHPEFSTRLGQTLDKLDTTLDGMYRTAGSSTPAAPVRQASYSTETTQGAGGSNVSSLASALTQLILDNPDTSKLQSAAKMLYLYVINLSSHPKIPRYRKIFTSNETYQNNITDTVGADSLLQALGFVERENSWEWEVADEEDCLERLRQAAAALSILKVKPAQDTPEALLQHVFMKVGLETAATPPRRKCQADLEFRTPVHADILSPPVTKKHLTPPLEVDFPVLTHPLAEIAESSDSTGSPVASLLQREEGSIPALLPSNLETDNNAENGETAIWK